MSRQDIAIQFNCDLADVEQVKNQNLYIVKGVTLVSYRTIVGKFMLDDALSRYTWILTKCKYSSTTSKQLSQFAREHVVTWQNEPFTV